MKLTFKHTALSLALAGSFTLTGCNFIGSGDPVFVEPTPEPTPEPTVLSVSGEATKGALLGADVFACLVKSPCVTADVNTVEGSTGYVGKTTTSTDPATAGEYSIELTPAAYGKAVTIRIIANSSTTMDCDTSDEACDFDLVDTELKTIAVVPTPATGQTATLANIDASALSTIAVELLEADETLSEDMTAEVLSTKAKAASKGVAKILGIEGEIDDNTDFLKLKVATAKSGNTKFDAADEKTKKLSLVNASLAKLAAAGEKLGTKIKEVASTVKNAVVNPASVNATSVNVIKNLATVVKAEVTANTSKVNTGGGTTVTAPVTKEPDAVTIEDVKKIAEETQQDIVSGGGSVTGGTGGTGASGADS